MSNDQFYKPGSISPSSIGPGNFYNDNDVADPTYPYTGPNPIPAGTTIIDQATFVNAQLIALPGAAPDPNFVPTEYIATQDVNNNITHLNIDVSNMYGGSLVSDLHPLGYRTINTDNILALTHPTLGVGVDVYDPAAIMAGINLSAWNTSAPCGFYLLAATVVSILDASRPRPLQKLRPKSVEDGSIKDVHLANAKLSLAGGIMTGDIDFNDTKIKEVVIMDYAEKIQEATSNDIDLSLGNVQTYTLSGDQTITFSNPPEASKAGSLTLFVTNGSSATLTWPTTVRWPGGNPPDLTASGTDVIVFTTIDGGLNWYGFLSGADCK